MKNLYLDNAWEYIWPGTRHNTATGESEPATGLTLTAHISSTAGGPTIHADLAKSMAERAGAPGEYFAIVAGDVLRTHLAALSGSVVWEVFSDGTPNVDYSSPRRVLAIRRP